MYPERTRTLVLAGTAANLWPKEDPVTRIVKDQLKILEKQGAVAAWNDRPTGVELSLDVLWEREEMKERGVLPEYEERIARFLKKCSRQDLVRWYDAQLRAIEAYLDRDLAEECARVTAPTLVVHGSNDRECPWTGAGTLRRGFQARYSGCIRMNPTASSTDAARFGRMSLRSAN